MIKASDIASVISTSLFGAITGWLVKDMAGAIVFGVLFGTLALLGARAHIRPAIVSVVLVATMAGGLIGSSIVEAICLPSTCGALETVGGTITALISFVGVGLVAALVTRSFDEYNEREAQGLPPTGVGCEMPEDD